jgi:hypothetical protein
MMAGELAPGVRPMPPRDRAVRRTPGQSTRAFACLLPQRARGGSGPARCGATRSERGRRGEPEWAGVLPSRPLRDPQSAVCQARPRRLTVPGPRSCSPRKPDPLRISRPGARRAPGRAQAAVPAEASGDGAGQCARRAGAREENSGGIRRCFRDCLRTATRRPSGRLTRLARPEPSRGVMTGRGGRIGSRCYSSNSL